MLVNVVRPPGFAGWHFLKLGSFPCTETGRWGPVFPDHYISKGWLLGLERQIFLGGTTNKRLGEHLHLEEAEKEFTIAFRSHVGYEKENNK